MVTECVDGCERRLSRRGRTPDREQPGGHHAQNLCPQLARAAGKNFGGVLDGVGAGAVGGDDVAPGRGGSTGSGGDQLLRGLLGSHADRGLVFFKVKVAFAFLP